MVIRALGARGPLRAAAARFWRGPVWHVSEYTC
jgi:hypothetical protein